MNIHADEKFLKDLQKNVSKQIRQRVERKIKELQITQNLHSVAQVKALSGHPGYYRIRIGDYRLGLRAEQGEIWLVRLLHRSEIYRYFP